MKRFIAGASCPECGAEESVYVLSTDEDTLYCADCGFEQTRPDKPAPESQLNENEQVFFKAKGQD